LPNKNKLKKENYEEYMDKYIQKYNKYSKKHPMDGIYWNDESNMYYIEYKHIACYHKILSVARNKILATLNVVRFQHFTKGFFEFDAKNFVYYRIDHFLLFDIQHIIFELGLDNARSNTLYNKYHTEIVMKLWVKNKFDCFFGRELINSFIVCEILSFTRQMAREFKEIVQKIYKKYDITFVPQNSIFIDAFLRDDIIDDLTNETENILDIGNKKYTLKLEVLFIPFVYNVGTHILYAQDLIYAGTILNIYDFLNRPVMYSILLSICGNRDRFIIIKFGYSSNIVNRLKDIANKYNADVFLLKLKLVNDKTDELRFHYMLRTCMRESIYEYQKDDITRVELYILNPNLIELFDNYSVSFCSNKASLSLSDQDKTFINHIINQSNRFYLFLTAGRYISNNLFNEYFIERSKHQIQIDIRNSERDIKYIDLKKEEEISKQKSIDLEREKISSACQIYLAKLEILKNYLSNNNKPSNDIINSLADNKIFNFLLYDSSYANIINNGIKSINDRSDSENITSSKIPNKKQ